MRCKCCGQSIEFDPEALILKHKIAGHSATIFRALAKSKAPVHKDRLIALMYEDCEDGGPDGAEGALRTHISRLRPKLKRYGFEIAGLRKEGYSLVKI